MAKAITEDSTRQMILEVLYTSEVPLAGKDIKKGLLERDVDKEIAKRVHSYLSSFKKLASPHVIHIDGKFVLSQAARRRFEEARGLVEIEEVVEVG